MNIFDILREHALRIPDQVATVSPRHRLTTWRKLYSRIERATARLQGEWLVGEGDTVIYAGHGHADALVLWLSLARLSARLLPLETPALYHEVARFAARSGAMLVLRDDELQIPEPGDDLAVQALSAIIARPCDYHPHDCPERIENESLLAPHADHLHGYSIAGLLDAPVTGWSASQPLFDPIRLGGQILPALVQGLTLELD